MATLVLRKKTRKVLEESGIRSKWLLFVRRRELAKTHSDRGARGELGSGALMLVKGWKSL